VENRWSFLQVVFVDSATARRGRAGTTRTLCDRLAAGAVNGRRRRRLRVWITRIRGNDFRVASVAEFDTSLCCGTEVPDGGERPWVDALTFRPSSSCSPRPFTTSGRQLTRHGHDTVASQRSARTLKRAASHPPSASKPSLPLRELHVADVTFGRIESMGPCNVVQQRPQSFGRSTMGEGWSSREGTRTPVVRRASWETGGGGCPNVE